jgi:peptidoglycan/LPS O-acetylase OafA/YrhL
VSAESKKHLSQSARRNIVTALLNLEGAVVLALGVFVLYLDLSRENISVAGSVEILPFLGVLLFSLLGGLGLLASAYSFKNKRRFGRAPAVLANLIALGVAKYQFEGGLWFVALPLVIVAAIIIYCAVTIVPESEEK